jgi:hypothetical protein
VRKEFVALRAIEDAEYERIFKLEHPDQVPSSIPFQEKEFGIPGSPGDEALQAVGVTKHMTAQLSSIVVSLALFEGDSTALCSCILHKYMYPLLVSDLTRDLVQGIRCYLHAQA